MNPFAPIRPDQEQAIHDLTKNLGRLTRERITKGLHSLSAGEADEMLRRLRNEPRPAVVVAPEPDAAAARAHLVQMRERLAAGYAGRAMQPIGLSKPSLFAGMNGNPYGTTR